MAKRILIMTQNFYPVIGSAGNRMKNIFQLLNENNIEADVLTTEPAYPNKNLYKNKEFWDDEDLNASQHKIIRVPIKNRKFMSHSLNRLFFYLEIMCRFLVMLWKVRKNKYDYILVSTPPIFIVFSAMFGKRIMKNKLILEVRDLWPDSLIGVKTFNRKWIIRFFRYLEKKMYRSADHLIINSKGFEEHIRSKLNNKNTPIIYLPNGPRKSEIMTQKPRLAQFRVVYTGNMGLAQDVDRLKLTAKLLHENDIRFDVLGYGVRTDEFKVFIKENKLTSVYMHHPTTRKKSLNLIKSCSVAVAFLNNSDVFSTVLPGKIIDYMTCGTPVIAGVSGAAAQLITESKVGYTFEEQDVEKMIKKIIELRDNPEDVIKLGNQGAHAVQRDFLWEDNILELVKIIK